MSSKNPFELRFDTLAMAKEMLDRQYDTNLQIFYEALGRADADGRGGKDFNEIREKYMPKMYNPSEIMAQAQELYTFVTKKD